MKNGRKRKYETAEELQVAVDNYFNELEITKKNPTVTGLAYYLGFASRKSLHRQNDHGEDHADVVDRARLRVEMMYEEKLLSRECVGAIFALKNFGWTDKQEVEHSGTVNIPIIKWVQPEK